MRVALLSDCYPPRLGGIETQVRDLGRQLLAAGHEVHVYTATGSVLAFLMVGANWAASTSPISTWEWSRRSRTT